MSETDKELRIDAELPGVGQKDVEVMVNDNVRSRRPHFRKAQMRRHDPRPLVGNRLSQDEILQPIAFVEALRAAREKQWRRPWCPSARDRRGWFPSSGMIGQAGSRFAGSEGRA